LHGFVRSKYEHRFQADEERATSIRLSRLRGSRSKGYTHLGLARMTFEDFLIALCELSLQRIDRFLIRSLFSFESRDLVVEMDPVDCSLLVFVLEAENSGGQIERLRSQDVDSWIRLRKFSARSNFSSNRGLRVETDRECTTKSTV